MWRKSKYVILAVVLLICCAVLVACGSGASQRELRTAAKATRMTYLFTDAFEGLDSVRSATKTESGLSVLVRCDTESFSLSDVSIPGASFALYVSREYQIPYPEEIELNIDVPFTAFLSATRGDAVLECDITILRAHDFGEWAYIAEPTCTEAGSKHRQCAFCDLDEVVAIDALGHDYTDWTEVRPVTCLEESERVRTCRRCEYEDREITAAPGHDLVHHEGKASCTEPGWAPYDTCSRCDYTTFEELPASGHHPVTDPAKEATCTEDGCSEGSHCEKCGEVFTEQIIYPALGHLYAEISHKDPTCTEAGLIVRKCSRCEDEEREEIAALGHSFDGEICTRCGYRAAVGLVYRLVDGYYVVESIGTFAGSELYVPATYNGLPVIGIDSGAFANATFVKRIILPVGLAYIDPDAFYGCDAIEEISAPSDIFYNTQIVDRAFGAVAKCTITGSYLYRDGAYVSPVISASSAVTMRATITTAGRFECNYAVSSERGSDILYVYYNGTLLDQISGEVGYKPLVLNATLVGDVIEFTYAKDSSINNGDDCAYVRFATPKSIPSSLKTVTLLDAKGNVESKIFYADGEISGVSFDKDAKLSDYTANAARSYPLYFVGTADEWRTFKGDHTTFTNKEDVYFYEAEHGSERNWRYVNGVPALGPYGTHTFENEGYTCVARVCSCGYTIPADTVDPVHKYSEWAVETPATCTVNGSETRRCALCGKVEQESIERKGHTPGEWTVSEPATCTKDGERVKKCTVCQTVLEREAIPAAHHYENGVCTVCGTPQPTFTRVNAEGVEDEEGNYIFFGEYPQSRVTDEDVVAALTLAAGDLPTESDSKSWTSYRYYKSSVNTVDYMWYIDLSYSENKYRGVFFTSYRPFSTTSASAADCSSQDNSGYYVNTIYWFKYEPIKWRILEDNDGEAFVFCENIIDSQEYYADVHTRFGDETVYPNNYKESNIRNWLNESFYNTAFGTAQKNEILLSFVDNSARSTSDSKNDLEQAITYSENTRDYVFLLSVQEVTAKEYGFNSNYSADDFTARYKEHTDYALSQGVWYESNWTSSDWWLRSPRNYYGSNSLAGMVSYSGSVDSAGSSVINTYLGVVPALRLRLHEPTPPAYTRVDAEGAEAEDGDYLLFGSYPQSSVQDASVVSALNERAGDLPTASDSGKWTSYGYYKNGVDTTAYMWYIDLAYEGAKYRGVYFTSYRPYYTTSDGTAENSFQDDNGYSTATVYWFLYEPIKWRILAEGEGEALILAELILDSQHFNYGNDSYNLYRDSTIRTWLNDTFYNTAFTALQRDVILLTEVENGARTTNPDGNASEWNYGANNNAYGNTQDYVFLLSEQEVTMESYGFDPDTNEFDEARKKNTTDYAQAQGAYTTDTTDIEGKGRWWLRSPHYSVVNYAYTVRNSGPAEYLTNYIRSTDTGVVPALRIRLKAAEEPQEPQQPQQEVSAAYTRVNSQGAPAEDGDYVLFGYYPQTQISDPTVVAALNEAADGLPTPSAPGLWRAYDYYVNGHNESVYMWYTDRKYEGERYRGVYFAYYRPYRTNLASYSDTGYQDDNGYYVSTTYWFKYEPIKWRILEEEGGEAFLLSEMILDSGDYYADASTGTFTHNDGIGYANNYVLSNIRKWLNDTFYNTAFKSAEKAIILTTQVDNSALTTTDAGSNLTQATKYESSYTEDYIYLLSLREVTSIYYGFDSDYNANDPARRKMNTDYAKSQGAYTHTGAYAGAGYWWLRSPSNGYDNYASDVSPSGSTGSGSFVSLTYLGIAPAIRISL